MQLRHVIQLCKVNVKRTEQSSWEKAFGIRELKELRSAYQLNSGETKTHASV